MKEDANLLEGMPNPKKQRIVRKKRFVSTKNVSVETAVRRLVAEEIGESEPTRDEKYILLQKYGVVDARIDRLVTKPKWMTEATWKRKQNDWFRMTNGIARRFQPKRNPQQPPPKRDFTKNPLVVKPWSQIEHKARNSRPNNWRNSRPNSAPTRTGNTQR